MIEPVDLETFERIRLRALSHGIAFVRVNVDGTCELVDNEKICLWEEWEGQRKIAALSESCYDTLDKLVDAKPKPVVKETMRNEKRAQWKREKNRHRRSW